MKGIIESIGALLRALFGSQGRFIEPLPIDAAEACLEEAAHDEERLRQAA
ncbi:MAG: hypothetical protein ACO1SV_14750 [Fimbriimonas sp.]